MISSLRDWISAISAISIIISLIDVITPENSAGKFVSLAGSLILTFVILSPIVNFNFAEIDFVGMDFHYGIEEQVNRVIENNEKLKVIVETEKDE